MTTENPMLARLTRGIDQERMRRLNRAALITGLVMGGVALVALFADVILSSISDLYNIATPFVLIPFLLSLLAVPALTVLVAILAAGVTHREIAGESGDLLWVTPLPSADIAAGFLEGVGQSLAWAQSFGLAFAATLGIGAPFLSLLFFLLFSEPGFAPPGPREISFALVGPTLLLLMIVGLPAAGAAWAAIRALIRIGVRVGVASAFWLRDRDSNMVQSASGGAMGVLILAMMLGCAALVWIPVSVTTFGIFSIQSGTILLAGAAILLLLAIPYGINAWMKRWLIRTIDRARARQ